jgi:hypothetical protein
MKEDEIVELYSKHVRDKYCIQTLVRRPEENIHMENLSADGRITVKLDIQESGYEDVNWIQVARVRIQL